MLVSKRELYEVLKSDDTELRSSSFKPENTLIQYLQTKFKLHHCSSIMLEELNRLIHSFITGLNQRWKTCHRNKNVFLKKYKDWLDTHITINNLDLASTSASKGDKKIGRPQKQFSPSGPKTKRRKVQSLLTDRSLSELTHATHLKLRQSGRRDAAGVLKQLTGSPKRATKVKKAIQEGERQTPQYSPEEALSLITAVKLSCRKYQIMRKSALLKGLKIYPSYEKIKGAKKMCYPPEDNCIFSESLAEVRLQSIVDLTIKRLCIVQKQVLDSIGNEGNLTLKNLTMIFKWGVDGSGGQSRYKQKSNEDGFDDTNVLATSMVPLQLHGFNEANQKTILWQNPRPSSTLYCRPIRFRFTKETNQSILEEFENVRNQITSLVPTLVEFNDQTLEISHRFEETMVDGKVCNVLASNKSTQKCYICKATPKEMNCLENIRRRTSDAHTFSWGLSTLHAQIRLMECILHIGYRLDVKKWQCRKAEEKQSVADRKKLIIDRFRSETGLLLDTPKQGGGNTNDGNSARRFFKNAGVASSITGVNQSLIERFYIILRTMTCGYDINMSAFKDYCDETANLYVSLYNWYPMPVTLHKILIHGSEVIENFLLPIGQMSEEAQESRHKEFRKFRLEHARKTSRIKANEDLLHNLLISSDPVITSLRPQENYRAAAINPAVLKLIQPPNIQAIREEHAEQNDSDSFFDNSDDTE